MTDSDLSLGLFCYFYVRALNLAEREPASAVHRVAMSLARRLVPDEAVAFPSTSADTSNSTSADTSNVVEKSLASLRLRTDAAKRFTKVDNATMLIRKVLRVAESHWRKLDAPDLLKDVYEGRRFMDRRPITRAIEKVAA